MRIFTTLALFALLIAPVSAQDQGGMFYAGALNGFSTSADPMTYLGPGPDNWAVTVSAAASEANSNFLFIDDTGFGNKWGDNSGPVAFETQETWDWQGSDAVIAVTAGNSYTFVWQDVADGAASAGIVFETSGALSTASGVSRSGPTSPPAAEPVTVTATLNAAAPTGQGVYLRYTDDSFATSTVAEMSCSGTSCSATIPGSVNDQGETVLYYVFSSADGLTLSGGQADRFTANLNNNSGANYSYVVDAPLPVELTSFTGAADGSRAVLNWATASETNNDGFEVQMRSDATFRTVDFVRGAGTTLEAQRYSFTTTALAPGDYTFRLRQVDLDGASEFSPVVELTIGLDGAFALALEGPNPFADQTALGLSVARAQNVEAGLYDLLGRKVATLHSGVVDGAVMLSVDASRLPAGLYVVRVQGETFRTSRTLTVAR